VNILFLSTENPIPPDHGHHLRTYNVLKHLAENNRVFFVGFAKSENEMQHTMELETLCATVDVIPLPEMAQPWRRYTSAFSNVLSRVPYIVRRYESKDARDVIRNILANNDIDVVHFDLPHLAGYIDEIEGLPRILVHHNVESIRVQRRAKVDWNVFRKLYLYSQYSKLRKLEMQICPGFDRCIAVSDADRDQLADICTFDNFTVVPNGVDTDFFQPTTEDCNRSGLVWTGSMAGAYNSDAVDHFLKSIAPLIHHRQPDMKMVFVGDKPTKLLLKRASQNENIIAAGYVNDVRPYVDEAEVFIAPMRSGSGTKLKILNAMAQAKPVVTTPMGAEGIDAEDDSEILISHNAEEFAAKVLGLIANPREADAIGARARRLIENKYDWRVIAKDMNRIYDDAVTRNVKTHLPWTAAVL
jgi:sugar transferase (PEP-CTERM/EpsH1 system associated)